MSLEAHGKCLNGDVGNLKNSTSACAGRHFSDNTLSIFIATVLHVFEISAGVDEQGSPVVLSAEIAGFMLTYVFTHRSCSKLYLERYAGCLVMYPVVSKHGLLLLSVFSTAY